MHGANYVILEQHTTALRLVIRDLGPWHTFKTVTNAAESIVADLVRMGQLHAGQRLFYYDSDGCLDELNHDGKRFIGYGSVTFDGSAVADIPSTI